MRIKIILILIIIGFVVTNITYSKPYVKINKGNKGIIFSNPQQSPNVTIQQVKFDPNNASTWVYNKGIFNQDRRTNNTPGYMWPTGSNKFACFTAGLSIGTMVRTINGNDTTYVLGEAMASYGGEYAQGYIDNTSGTPVVNTLPRVFRIKRGDNANNNQDYADWGLMIPYGAPYIDVNNNHQWDPGIDIPGIKDASQVIFGCLTDGFADEHNLGEGFGGGTAPIYAELHLTAWGYDTPGLEDIQFLRFILINKCASNKAWTKTYMGIVVDPDLGWADDDYIGCDTTKDMGYVYNGDNDDDVSQSPYAYGPNPPAFGMDYFTSPINRSTGDTLGLTSFVYFTNTGSGGPVCENDPNGEQLEAYRMLQGYKKDGTPWLDPTKGPVPTDSSWITKFCYPGDPETNVGWTELKGSFTNCGPWHPPAPTPTLLTTNPTGDRRYIFNSGSDNFIINPNDTQNIVLAQFTARGSSNLNSVTRLKKLDEVAQKIFDANFNVIPPPEPPAVSISYIDAGNGRYKMIFNWDNRSESYNFQDTLFNPPDSLVFYKFQGYEIYEIKNSQDVSIPDFSKPETINNSEIALLDIFDINDNLGVIIDTLNNGYTFGPFPVLPPYTIPPPTNFPNKGIYRSRTIEKTMFAQLNGGTSDLIYGKTYKFAVLAYAVNTKYPNTFKRGQSIMRNSLISSILTITATAPPPGINYTYYNDDTLNTNRRDLGVMPIVKGQEFLLDAKYKVLFGSPDTTYKILRMLSTQTTYDTIYKNLRPSIGNADDSAKIVDGVLIKVMKMKPYNIGVVKDVTLPRDSIQTRYNGWEWIPSANRYLTKSDTLISSTMKYQSESMSISWPTSNTFNGTVSSVPAHGLSKVKIVWTDLANGQYALRYCAKVTKVGTTWVEPPVDSSYYPFIPNPGIGYPYQDKRQVPLKVFAVEEDAAGNVTERQVNCAFLEMNDTLVNKVTNNYVGKGNINGKWDPTTFKSGGFEILYIMKSNYGDTSLYFTGTTPKNLKTQQAQFDIMYVWVPKRIAGKDFTPGDIMYIYPYTVTVPNFASGVPLSYTFSTTKPVLSQASLVASLDKIRVVPNPYYGYNSLQTSTYDRFVTFTRLPKELKIKIYTINGDLIRVINKNSDATTIRWNLRNQDEVPVASGLYIALIDVTGVGQKIIKLAVFTPEERVDF